MTKVSINFIYPNGDMITKKMSIQHLRNQELNENGGVIESPNGGYTIVSDENANMVVATCNYRTDRFNRKRGLKEALAKYWKYKICDKDFKVDDVKSYQDNTIDVFLEYNWI